MNYLFFDTECANCLNGEGKICSVGYVKTDTDFHVLKKRDILIDPNAPFLLGNAKKGEGIQLGYPLSRFRYSHTFPHYYEEIKKLFTAPETLCFGFCIHQDIGFLDYTCARYGLPFFSFEYVDIQKLDKALYGWKDYRGLDTLVESFGLAKFTYHRSDDDAMMSMEVMAKLLQENNLTLEEAMKKFPEIHGESLALADKLEQRRQAKAKKRLLHERANILFIKTMEPSLSYYHPFFWNKKVFLKSTALYNHLDFLLKNKDRFQIRGISFVENPAGADILVYDPWESKTLDSLRKVNPKGIYMTFQHFRRKLGTGFGS